MLSRPTRTALAVQTAALAALSIAFVAVTLSAQPAKPVKVKEDKPGLLKLAKISADSAIAIARATLPGATISSAEIENEDSALIYSFDMKIAGKKGTEEVHIDAKTGKVLKQEHEDAAAEKKEKAAEKAEQAAKAKKGKPPV